MQTQPTIEPTGSPVPGVIPDPVRARRDTVAAQGSARGRGSLPIARHGQHTAE